MSQFLLVAVGGAIGASLRHAVNLIAGRLFGASFPYGTMTVNIVGSLAMGLLIGWLAQRAAGDASLRLFIATGLLGGFTTFSAFSLDAVSLYQRGDVVAAATYVVLSVVLALAALFVGLYVMRGA